jgi:hypothetical protein
LPPEGRGSYALGLLRTPQALQAVKSVYDPHNVFALNRNIPPGPPGGIRSMPSGAA